MDCRSGGRAGTQLIGTHARRMGRRTACHAITRMGLSRIDSGSLSEPVSQQ